MTEINNYWQLYGLKIYYFSDGCAAQYKNCKNFLNLCKHKADFGLDAEWHFFCTSHGKGPCDGCGGCIKRLARKASLQRPYGNHIISSQDLYDFAVTNIKGMSFRHLTNKDHDDIRQLYADRYAEARTVTGTQKLHCIIPTSENTILTKQYSSLVDGTKVTLTATDVGKLLDVDINGFVVVKYDNSDWLAYVLDKESG